MRRTPSWLPIVIGTVIVLGLLVNLGLSYYIQAMKERNYALIPESLRGQCFDGAEGGASCGAVQTSVYSTTGGISNPYYGYVGFPLLIALVGAAYWSRAKRTWWHTYAAKITFIGLACGAAFSIWLLYAQFFLIHQTCIYCLWVDGIMITSAVLFASVFREQIA